MWTGERVNIAISWRFFSTPSGKRKLFFNFIFIYIYFRMSFEVKSQLFFKLKSGKL